MEVSNYRCDICGKKAEGDDYNKPKGWFNINQNTEDKRSFWQKNKDICEECAKQVISEMPCSEPK